MSNRYQSSFKSTVCGAALCLVLGAAANAHEPGTIEPRIGYKDAPVLMNDLRVLGFPNAEIVSLGETAEIKMRVDGDDVRIRMDRRAGDIQILQASPKARATLTRKIPARRMVETIGTPVLKPPIAPKIIKDPTRVKEEPTKD